LVGIFSQLVAPDPTAPSRGTTVIDYSSFLAQVRAGNVLVVVLQDQEIEGALARPLSRSQVTPAPQTKTATLASSVALSVGSYAPGSDFPSLVMARAPAFLLLDATQVAATRLTAP